MNEVTRLWGELQTLGFPVALSGATVNDVKVLPLNSKASECIDTFITNKAQLDAVTKQQLQDCLLQLRRINPEMTGEAQVYFGKLYRLCDLIATQS